MIAQVTVDPDGAVIVLVDTDDMPEDEDARALAGLTLDDMLLRASGTAVRAWLELRTETEAGE